MSALSSLLRFTITLQAPTGAPDKWGNYTYGAPARYAAHVAFTSAPGPVSDRAR